MRNRGVAQTNQDASCCMVDGDENQQREGLARPTGVRHRPVADLLHASWCKPIELQKCRRWEDGFDNNVAFLPLVVSVCVGPLVVIIENHYTIYYSEGVERRNSAVVRFMLRYGKVRCRKYS